MSQRNITPAFALVLNNDDARTLTSRLGERRLHDEVASLLGALVQEIEEKDEANGKRTPGNPRDVLECVELRIGFGVEEPVPDVEEETFHLEQDGVEVTT